MKRGALPPGMKCPHCDEDISQEDPGFIIPSIGLGGEPAMTYEECFVRQAAGRSGTRKRPSPRPRPQFTRRTLAMVECPCRYNPRMRYEDIHPSLRSALGLYEGFRKLGFSSDEIHVGIIHTSAMGNPPPWVTSELVVVMFLKSQGKQFVIMAGEIEPATPDEFTRLWEGLCAAVNDGAVPSEDLSQIYQESQSYRQAVEFVFAIMMAGIRIPMIDSEYQALLN